MSNERTKQLLREARRNVNTALRAHQAGELGLRDTLLRSAADRYAATGHRELAGMCKAKVGGNSWDVG
jgi:hypothetical protein